MPTGVSFIDQFLSQPIDEILFDILIWFGWIPIAIVLAWGFAQMFKNSRQGMYGSRLKWVVLAINVPSFTEQSPKALENMFANLWGAKSSLLWKEKWIVGKYQTNFSFEIVSTEGYIQYYIRCETRYRDLIEASIYAHYPDAEITEVEDYSRQFPNTFPNGEYEAWGGEIWLKKAQYLPMRTYVDFEDRLSGEIKDPLGQILEQLAKMKPGEHFWYQVLIQPFEDDDWKDQGYAFIKKVYGTEDKPKPSFLSSTLNGVFWLPNAMLQEITGVDLLGDGGGDDKAPDAFRAFMITPTEKEQVDAVARKIGKVGFKTKIRLIYWGKPDVFWKQARTGLVKGMLHQYAHNHLNGLGFFVPSVPKDDTFWMRWSYEAKQGTLVSAYQKRSMGIGAHPKVMNVEELATLWHFPTVELKAPLIKKSEFKKAEPPVGLPVGLGDTIPAEAPTIKEVGFEEITPPIEEMLPGISDTIGEDTAPEMPSVTPPTIEQELPRPQSPTKEEGSSSDDDTFVPPNLPV